MRLRRKYVHFAVPAFILLALAVGLYVLKSRFERYPAAVLAQQPSTAVIAGKTGLRRPDFSLADLAGTIRHVREWDGQLVFINFWATWCPPCLREIPTFIELQDRYAAQGLRFIGIAIQDPEPVAEFVAAAGINYPVLVGQAEAIEIAREYGNRVGALPFTVAVDRGGKIVFARGGELDREQAEEIIRAYL